MALKLYKPKATSGKISISKPKVSFKGIKMAKAPAMKSPKLPKMPKVGRAPKIKIK